jgi:uncharacterized protein YeaO (DUF488 family)
MGSLRGKRIYDDVSEDDGTRILIDRLWPRGIKKVNAHLDGWDKAIAPSSEIRKKFHADDDYEAFTKAYEAELDANQDTTAFVSSVAEKLKEGNVTLLTASKDPERCNCSVVLDYLKAHIQ